MCALLVDGLMLFALSLALHIIVWRVRRPDSYRGWLPALLVIFGPVAAGIAWLMVPPGLPLAAVLLLHGSLAAVYTIGYTLVTASSPSLAMLKMLDRSPAGISIAALRLPDPEGALTTDRLANLAAAGLIRQIGPEVHLAGRGMQLTRLVLLYRHAIGLRDGEGG